MNKYTKSFLILISGVTNFTREILNDVDYDDEDNDNNDDDDADTMIWKFWSGVEFPDREETQ